MKKIIDGGGEMVGMTWEAVHRRREGTHGGLLTSEFSRNSDISAMFDTLVCFEIVACSF